MRKNSFVRRLAFPYFVVLILPIIFIWLYLFPQLEQRMVDNATMHQKNNIARLSVVLDQNVSLMTSNAVSLASNPKLAPYSIRNTSLGNYQAVQELKKSFLWTNGFVSQSFYYLKANNCFYTSEASYPLSWLTDTSYGYCYYNWSEQDMYQDLQELKTLRVRPMESVAYPEYQTSRVISVLVPVPITSSTPYGVLIFWVDQDALQDLISPLQSNPSECTLIYDSTGRRIFSLGENQLNISLEEIDKLIAEGKTDSCSQISLGGSDYFLAVSARDNTRWQCVSLTPADTLMKSVHAMRINLLLTTLLLLAACVFVAFFASRSSFHSIRTLENKARLYVDASEQYGSELDVVHQALDHLETQTVQLQQRYLETIPLIKERLLYALISGKYKTVEEFNRDAAEAKMHFSLPRLCVTVLRTGGKETFDLLEYLESLEEALPNGLEGYYVFDFDRQDILFVSAVQNTQTVHVYISDICADVNTTQHQALWAAVGPYVSDAAELMQSYSTAINRIDKMTLTGNHGVESCDQTETPQSETVLPQNYPISLSVIKMDAAEIRRNVEEVLAFFSCENASPVMIRTLYLNTVMTLLQGLDNMDIDTQPLYTLASVSKRITYDEMAANLHKLCETLCGCIDKGQQEVDVSIDEVKEYICQNCLDYSFSVQSVAEHFSMSYTGFSHYFKRKMDVSCKQFVDKYRAERAIEMLMNTSAPLEEIGQRLGFGNATSFIRSFKKITGRTPGSYRNL